MSKLLTFYLSHFLAIGIVAVAGYVYGRRLAWRVRFDSLLEQASLSIALGLGVISYVVFLLGLLGLLYRSFLLIALLVGFLSCHKVWITWPGSFALSLKRFIATRKSSIAFFVVISAFIFTLSFYVWSLPLYPPTAFDATMYHLAHPKIYVQNHRLVPKDYFRYPVFPEASEMLFALGLLVQDDILAQLMELIMMVTLAGAVMAFGKRFFSERTGYWAAAILLANPTVVVLGSVAYIDMGLREVIFAPPLA